MLRGGDVDEIRTMHRQGLSISDIAGLTGFDRTRISWRTCSPARWRHARPATCAHGSAWLTFPTSRRSRSWLELPA